MGNEIWRGRGDEAPRMERIWEPGDLYHAFNRGVANPAGHQVDKLRQVLTRGLIVPANDPDRLILQTSPELTDQPVVHDKFVLLQRFNPKTPPYLDETSTDIGYIFINRHYIEPGEPDDPDEIYVQGSVDPREFRALAVPEWHAEATIMHYLPLIDKLNLSVFDLHGHRYI